MASAQIILYIRNITLNLMSTKTSQTIVLYICIILCWWPTLQHTRSRIVKQILTHLTFKQIWFKDLRGPWKKLGTGGQIHSVVANTTYSNMILCYFM